MGRVIHFEINVDQPEKSADFYSEVFDWVISKKESDTSDYWLVHTGRQDLKGINGGLKKTHLNTKGIIPTVGIENLAETMKKIEKSGGKILSPRTALPATGYLAYCSDPEGNVFALLEYDSDAE